MPVIQDNILLKKKNLSGCQAQSARQPNVIVRVIIILPCLTYTALTTCTLFMKLSTAVEADSRLTLELECKYYTDWPKAGTVAIVQKCKL